MVSVTAIIQARMGSTRFPGKSLRPIAGLPLLEHIINRLKQVPEIDLILLAIPENETESPLIEFAHRLHIPLFQGSEEDVLDRFIKAGESVQTEHLVRVCGDNPLIDIPLLRSLIQAHLTDKADYTLPQDPVPLGSACEVVRLAALKKINELAKSSIYREHVTTWFHEHPSSFRIKRINVPDYLKNHTFRLTVDTDQDFQIMDELFNNLTHSPESPLNLETVIEYLIAHPETVALNIDIPQKNWRKENH
ncbi:MAG: glycosyltransferase family protein [Nitrospina sp.]|jgi:spore coat polysaccharide biosynthesis protein SpsF|nr:glycosyltransferase family protein [Nitrospina sp.]MBT3877412.1 glycosyltransferase family protein [Nitrospina sp.]MBT4046732.1 glycosyltransferase family protein [Nitrospina sp.]MBT4556227.1 glycosyltransferase family protein [Nitrospina sp.]MBT5348507.1 glycosyltransferase family protein [Nitrospina sp.]